MKMIDGIFGLREIKEHELATLSILVDGKEKPALEIIEMLPQPYKGKIYLALNSLRDSDLVSLRLGERTQLRGGNRRGFWQITTKGKKYIRKLSEADA